jgi:hypothetical protein
VALVTAGTAGDHTVLFRAIYVRAMQDPAVLHTNLSCGAAVRVLNVPSTPYRERLLTC